MGIFEAVKEQVTARDAAERYGIRVGRNGMARCPFHDDRHPSMKVDRRFHCFGCQEDGDVIDLAAKLFGLSLKEAAGKLAGDFGIAYESRADGGGGRASPIPFKRKLSEELRAKQTEANCIRILSDYNHLLKEWKLRYAPRDPDGEWHPLFVEALDRLDYTEYLLDILLSGTAEEKSALIRERGKEVEELGKRISGFAAGRTAERAERGGFGRTGTDGC